METCTEKRARIDSLKDLVRHPFAWPGGYGRLAVMSDGGTLCKDCLASEFHNVLHSTKFGYADGWNFAGVFVNWEDDSLYCDHCGDRIPSEYAEND